MQDYPLAHTPAQHPCQRGVRQPPRVQVREEAAIRDAELRRVSMATQAGETPPELGGLGCRRGESRARGRHRARGDGRARAQRGIKRQPCPGQFLHSTDREACERLLGGLAGRAAHRGRWFYSQNAI